MATLVGELHRLMPWLLSLNHIHEGLNYSYVFYRRYLESMFFGVPLCHINPRLTQKWLHTFNSDEKTADSATRNGQGSESPQRVHSEISLLYFLGQDDVIQSSYTLSDSTKNTLRRVRRII